MYLLMLDLLMHCSDEKDLTGIQSIGIIHAVVAFLRGFKAAVV